MYLVAEWITTSAPSASGDWKYGVQNVLSTTTSWPGADFIAATAAMSMMRSIGLVGVSIQNIFVFGRIAARTASRSVMSTNVELRSKRSRTRVNSRYVPPYVSSLTTTW